MTNTTQKFTKEDFLNAAALVEKLNKEYGTKYDIETIKKALKSEYRKKTQFKIKFNTTPLVYDAK